MVELLLDKPEKKKNFFCQSIFKTWSSAKGTNGNYRQIFIFQLSDAIFDLYCAGSKQLNFKISI